MSQSNGKSYTKRCKDGCGEIIEWNKENQIYVDPYTGKKHECNIKPKFHNGMKLYEENKMSAELLEFVELLNKYYFTTQKIKFGVIYF